MTAIPVSFGDFAFLTRDAAEGFIRVNIINPHIGLTRVPAGRIHDALVDLIQQHPQAGSKIGSGIDHFRVDPASTWKPAVPMKSTNQTLVVVRLDTTEEDWSWTAAVRQPSEIAQKRSAMRNVLYPRIQALKSAALLVGPVKCPRTGVLITSVSDAQIVHRSPSWAQITDDFATTIGGWTSLVTVSAGAGAEISDPAVRAAWEAYYDSHARPEIESKF
jgi:hypothetical protein